MAAFVVDGDLSDGRVISEYVAADGDTSAIICAAINFLRGGYEVTNLRAKPMDVIPCDCAYTGPNGEDMNPWADQVSDLIYHLKLCGVEATVDVDKV